MSKKVKKGEYKCMQIMRNNIDTNTLLTLLTRLLTRKSQSQLTIHNNTAAGVTGKGL